ncbi:MAG: TonB-dependent receptor, partial [Acidobacteria bacterium]|nr:TonB-dependent receptor [Acidobacteriota bacterium]
MNGRNIYQLAELQPGIVRVAGSGLQESDTTDAQVGASGTRFRDNQILLDGVTNNNDRQGGRTTLALSPDAVEQFRVVTNNLSAEFGRSGGGLISVVTKGGTNAFHGTLFEFHRNDNLDAATTFEARAGRKSEFKRNHFGGTLGGPIFKNRTFFFFSYQGLRQIRPALQLHTVETPQFRDFVLQTRPNSLAARLLRDFPPLLAPTMNIRDVGSPAPGVRVFNETPDGIPDIGDVFIPIPGFTFDDQYSIRIDHTLNDGKDIITGRYSLNDRKEQRPGDNSARAFSVDFLEKDQNISLSHIHTFSPTVTNELRVGYNYDPQINAANFPEIPFVGFSVAGRSVSQFSQTFGFVFPLDFRLHTYQLYDALTMTRGNHGLKIGGDVRQFRENSDFPTFFKPLVTFNDILDFADDEVLSITARVDPLTGQPTGTYRHFRITEFGLFIQDDWKATPRLTLNIGLRYDNFGTLSETDEQVSTLVFDSASLADARVVQVDELYERDNNNFAPRLGFAYDPTGNGAWAIRGGAGLFYSRIWTNFSGNSRFNTPFSLPVSLSALTPGQNPSAAYRIPFTGDPAFARPLDARGGSTALRPAVQTVDRNLRAPHTAQWFLGVQRQLPGNWVAEANYLGSAGRKLLFRQELNRFSGDRADGVVNRVNQSFGSIVHGFNAISSIYHGLATQLSKRFSDGYTAQLAYTFSRSIDSDSEPFGGGPGEQQGLLEVSNIRLDRAFSAFDATHRFAGNFIYELPFFRNTRGLAGSLLGGWQVNSIVSLQSGFPFTVLT